MTLAILSVGQPYPGGPPRREGSTYQYDVGGHALVHAWASPSRDEVRQVRRSPTRIAVVERSPVIWLCWRHGPQPWSDAPYSWHLVPEDRQVLPPGVHGVRDHALLHVVLVDLDGIVRGLRAITLSPATTGALHGAIRRQAESPWDAAAFEATIRETYARMDSAQLAATALAAEVAGR